MNNYKIQINNQILTRKSKRSDFTHAVVGRPWDGGDAEPSDSFRIIAVRTSKEAAIKELQGWTMNHKDAQVLELQID